MKHLILATILAVFSTSYLYCPHIKPHIKAKQNKYREELVDAMKKNDIEKALLIVQAGEIEGYAFFESASLSKEQKRALAFLIHIGFPNTNLKNTQEAFNYIVKADTFFDISDNNPAILTTLSQNAYASPSSNLESTTTLSSSQRYFEKEVVSDLAKKNINGLKHFFHDYWTGDPCKECIMLKIAIKELLPHLSFEYAYRWEKFLSNQLVEDYSYSFVSETMESIGRAAKEGVVPNFDNIIKCLALILKHKNMDSIREAIQKNPSSSLNPFKTLLRSARTVSYSIKLSLSQIHHYEKGIIKLCALLKDADFPLIGFTEGELKIGTPDFTKKLRSLLMNAQNI